MSAVHAKSVHSAKQVIFLFTERMCVRDRERVCLLGTSHFLIFLAFGFLQSTFTKESQSEVGDL